MRPSYPATLRGRAGSRRGSRYRAC
jgi:hypothetical protein